MDPSGVPRAEQDVALGLCSAIGSATTAQPADAALSSSGAPSAANVRTRTPRAVAG